MDEIHGFLHYSYYPNSDECSVPETIIDASAHDPLTSSLVERGEKALQKSVEANFERESFPENATHTLLLSGGLDSRTVLALLLDQVGPDQIAVGSYGVPGAFDYELAQEVAKKAGVTSYRYDLRPQHFEWSYEKLLDYARTLPHPTRIFEAYINHYARTQVAQNCAGATVQWSGWLGETTAGSHHSHYLPNEFGWDAHCGQFARWNNATTVDLTPIGFDPRTSLPEEPPAGRSDLNYGEQLDYAVRQQCFIKPFVNPSDCFSPFLDEKWLQFILPLPRRLRVNRRLFKKIVRRAWPRLFALPTETNDGLPLKKDTLPGRTSHLFGRVRRKLQREIPFLSTYRKVQYFDFSTALRTENSFRGLVGSLLARLDHRPVVSWIDVDRLWRAHQDGMDLNLDLRILAGLELCLEACE
ncbi:asparagine synthase-related protein [Salinibacter sp.]|uniref:asparagine synthase-related protein n=1 Tax=Salinibacter sp. TaxID=2065818 RepID=UPI0035D41F28